MSEAARCYRTCVKLGFLINLLKFAPVTEERNNKLQRVLAKRHSQFTVVLVDVEDSGNVAAVLRSCDAVGVHEVFVINTFTKKEKRWKRRASRSAEKWIVVHQYESIAEAFTQIQSGYEQVLATHLGKTAVGLYEVDFNITTALIFGNERLGLPDEVLELCTGNLLIPQVGMLQSLNISVACAVSLYEAFRQNNTNGVFSGRGLNLQTSAQLKQQWTDR